jgi:hypothetical protein
VTVAVVVLVGVAIFAMSTGLTQIAVRARRKRQRAAAGRFWAHHVSRIRAIAIDNARWVDSGGQDHFTAPNPRDTVRRERGRSHAEIDQQAREELAHWRANHPEQARRLGHPVPFEACTACPSCGLLTVHLLGEPYDRPLDDRSVDIVTDRVMSGSKRVQRRVDRECLNCGHGWTETMP